jgi:hypothetical protein
MQTGVGYTIKHKYNPSREPERSKPADYPPAWSTADTPSLPDPEIKATGSSVDPCLSRHLMTVTCDLDANHPGVHISTGNGLEWLRMSDEDQLHATTCDDRGNDWNLPCELPWRHTGWHQWEDREWSNE